MEAFIVDAARTAGGKRDGALKDWHPADLGAAVLDALVERTGDRSRRHRRRDRRLRRTSRRAGLSHRPQHGAGFEASRQRPRRHHRPPVRKLAAVGSFRRAGRDERNAGHGHRSGRREHDARADGHAGHPADAGGHRHRPVAAVDQGPLRRQRLHAVPRRRDDGEEVRLYARGARRFRARKPPQGGCGDAGRSVRGRDRAAAGQRRHAIAPTKAFATTRQWRALRA